MNELPIAQRINSVVESKSVQLAAVISELRAQGETIISFNVGEPDFETPQEVIEATQKALKEGHTRYALVPGEPFLRDAIAHKLRRDQGIEASAKNICVSNGSKQVLYSIFQVICDTGDEVIVPIPYWVSFPEAIRLAGAHPRFVSSEKGELNIEGIEKVINDKTKAIIINSPNNPSGLVFTKEQKQRLVELCRKHHLYLISDEAYETLIYEEDSFIGPAGVADQKLQNTLIVQSFSKSYCMTGFRLGYVAGSESFIKALNKLQSHLCGNTPVFVQKGAEAALKNEKEIVSQMRQTFRKRSLLAYELCKDIFPETPKPQGAFYLFPKIQEELIKRFESDEALALHILKEAKVALLPGSFFGQSGFLRICFASSEENIRDGFKAIKDCL